MPDFEVFSEETESASITLAGGELKAKESSASKGYGIRALSDRRIGFAYCQSESGMKTAKEHAQRASRLSVESGFSFAPKMRFGKLDVLDRKIDPADFESLLGRVDAIRQGAESLGGRSRVIVSCDRTAVSLSNSEGIEAAYEKSLISVYAECMNGEGFGSAYQASTRMIPDPHSIGLEAAGIAKGMQGAVRPAPGKYDVVFRIEALESLIDTFLPSFSGDWKRRGITKLREESKFSPMLTICEDGLSNGTGARPFDDEGTPSEKRYLVKSGKVGSFFYDRETAALSGNEGSGCCNRASYSDPPALGTSNIVIPPGNWKDIGDIGSYIEINQAHGAHTANPTSGAIGLETTVAFLVEKDKRIPLKGFMVSGNVFDMFSNILAVESKTRTLGSLTAPRIAFPDVSIVS